MHLQGFRLRVRLGDVQKTGAVYVMSPFVVARYDFDDNTDGLEVTNTEGVRGGPSSVPDFAGELSPAEPPARSVTPGSPKATISLEQATLITNPGANPFVAPFTLKTGKYVRLEIFPNRGSALRHLFPAVLLTKLKGQGQVAALQPLTLEFETDGPYFLYQ